MTWLDAQISAEPSRAGVVLQITRRKTRRIWIANDEIPLVIRALQARVPPVEVRQVAGRAEEAEALENLHIAGLISDETQAVVRREWP